MEEVLMKLWSKNFMRYSIVGLFTTILSTLFLIMLVDYLGLWVGYANPLVVVFIFILKYLLYDKVGMVSHE